MDEACSAIDLAAPLLPGEVAGTLKAVREVVDGGDTVKEMIDAPVQREPVEILRLGAGGHLAVNDTYPFPHVLIGRQAAERALPGVAVSGGKARDDELALRIVGDFSAETDWWFAVADDQLAEVVDRASLATSVFRMKEVG
jgi:hypothetical protein